MNLYMLALDAGRLGVYHVGTDRFGTLRGDLEEPIRYAGPTAKVKSLHEKLTIASLQALDKLVFSPLAPGII